MINTIKYLNILLAAFIIGMLVLPFTSVYSNSSTGVFHKANSCQPGNCFCRINNANSDDAYMIDCCTADKKVQKFVNHSKIIVFAAGNIFNANPIYVQYFTYQQRVSDMLAEVEIPPPKTGCFLV
jgi:hypothetical protein